MTLLFNIFVYLTYQQKLWR